MTDLAPDIDRLLRIEEVSAWLGKPEGTLRSWRHLQVGPASFKVGGSIVYRLSVVKAWIAEQEALTGSHAN